MTEVDPVIARCAAHLRSALIVMTRFWDNSLDFGSVSTTQTVLDRTVTLVHKNILPRDDRAHFSLIGEGWRLEGSARRGPRVPIPDDVRFDGDLNLLKRDAALFRLAANE